MRLAFTLFVALLAVVLLLSVSSCGGNDADDGDSLKGTEWTLVSGVDAPPDSSPTIGFDGDGATGFSGCNYYGGEYEIEGDSIEIGEVYTTAMGCLRPELETTEATYYSVFDDVDGWAIEDGDLILSSDGDDVLRYVAATGR
jgi:heat shock protein HslJ